MSILIPRQDVTTSDGTTPEGGVYITVKLGGSIASIVDVNGNAQSNPFQSANDGSFSYYVATAGVYTEEYRFNLGDSARTVEAVTLAYDEDSAAILASQSAVNASNSADQASAAQAAIMTAIGNGGADVALRADLAVGTGGGLVGWLASWTGAVFRTISARLTDTVSVKDFGALGDAVLNSGQTAIVSGTDDTTAIQAALNYLSGIGGGKLFFPKGNYLVSTYLTLPQNVRISGASRRASMLVSNAAGGGGASLDQNARNGSIFYSNWPSNSSTAANIAVEHLGFVNTNAANVGAPFYDNGGTYLSLRQIYSKGFKYGPIFDQSELFDVTESSFTPANLGGACVWLANGAVLKSGNLGGFTNRLSIAKCQLAAVGGSTATVNLIQDDGGADHSYENNNYQGGIIQIRLSGVNPGRVRGGEYESGFSNCIDIFSTKSDGSSNGGSVVSVEGGIISAPVGGSPVHANSGAGSLFIDGGVVLAGGGSNPAIGGCANLAFLGIGNHANTTGDLLTDNWATDTFIPFNLASAAPASGAYRQGRMKFNRAPTAGSVLGWRCVLTGTPGTWETLYCMNAAKGANYTAWTGTANRATKDTSTATLTDVAQTLKALIDDLQSRGVI